MASGLIVASFTLWEFSQLNLQAGYWDFFWPQFLQGISLAFLFVPLTTVTMGSQSHGAPMSTAAQQSYAAMFALVRQQAAILSYLEVFRDLAVVFVVVAPLVLLMRRPQKSSGARAVH